MWEPDPSWVRLPSGASGTSEGVWRVADPVGPLIAKRLRAPIPGDDPRASIPDHVSYWRREAEVALDVGAAREAAVRPPECVRIDTDDEGVTLWTREVTAEDVPPAVVAYFLGRFSATAPEERPWLAVRLLRDRLSYAEQRGGWPTLGRTTLADVSEHLWRRREHWLTRYEALPIGRAHGDATPANFLARCADGLIAVDWQAYGSAPVGADLGYLSLSVPGTFDTLCAAYLEGLHDREATVDPDNVVLAARVMAVYTAMTRAEWALARVAPGEGALAGKFRHPAVAPHLRVLQQQNDHITALLG